MKYKIILACALFHAMLSHAQNSIDGLAKAERSFAAHAVSHGIKPAFLQFADSMGVMFDQGKPVNAIQLWNARENRPGILNWRPDYTEIAASHDFGYTTGPWTFQPNSLQDSITGRGRFITVWHINNKGEWKFLVDLGVSNIPASPDTILRKIEITDPSIEAGNATNLLETENEFIAAAKQSLKDAYLKYLSHQTILNRNGILPAKTNEDITNISNGSPQSVQYKVEGSGIASSGDLGYVYGSTIINGKTDSYLHIWRKEKDGWKLALEVLHP
jgi:ketosteroid isomerase-like protein